MRYKEPVDGQEDVVDADGEHIPCRCEITVRIFYKDETLKRDTTCILST